MVKILRLEHFKIDVVEQSGFSDPRHRWNYYSYPILKFTGVRLQFLHVYTESQPWLTLFLLSPVQLICWNQNPSNIFRWQSLKLSTMRHPVECSIRVLIVTSKNTSYNSELTEVKIDPMSFFAVHSLYEYLMGHSTNINLMDSLSAKKLWKKICRSFLSVN